MTVEQKFVHPMVMEAALHLESAGEGRLVLGPAGVERLRGLLCERFEDPSLVSAVRALVTFAHYLSQDSHARASAALLEVVDIAAESLGRLGIELAQLEDDVRERAERH